jgi:hypothetical protein
MKGLPLILLALGCAVVFVGAAVMLGLAIAHLAK